MIEDVKRNGDDVRVVVEIEVGGGLWRKMEKMREIGIGVEGIAGEIVREVNELRDDGEELMRLESCSKWFRQSTGRSDLMIEVELMPIVRGLSKPEVKKLFELGIKRFLRRPEIDPKDYLKGPNAA